MSKVTFDYSKTAGVISAKEIENMKPIIETAKATLVNKTGAGNDFLGWIDLPVNYDKEEFARIQAAAAKIASDSDVLIVIGIGGSYLGARAAIEFLSNSFYNNQPKSERKTPEIYYAGNSISGTYLKHLCKLVEGRDFSVNVISKSGTTTEPAIAFRVFKKMLEERYGKEGAAKRIYATTDKSRGALKKLATEEGYETFVVPDDVGGRFSVLTAVGLLPIAVSGADITKLMEGAASGREARDLVVVDAKERLLFCYGLAGVLIRFGEGADDDVVLKVFVEVSGQKLAKIFPEVLITKVGQAGLVGDHIVELVCDDVHDELLFDLVAILPHEEAFFHEGPFLRADSDELVEICTE